jgi:hypothetical protein
MTPRYTGTVVFYRHDPPEDFGEIEPTGGGHAPFHVRGADLRRCGATAIGTMVTFEIGTTANEMHGAIRVEKVP